MSNPSMSFDHKVRIASGPVEPHTLQLGAVVAAAATFKAGSIVSRNSDGEIIAGCANDKMPLFAINGALDLDVVSEGSDYAGGQGVSGGNVNTYVAVGGYELFTSEYDTATDNDYTFDAKLIACTATANVGKVKIAPFDYSNYLVCGVVSRGVDPDQYGKNVLYFWPTYLPPLATASA